MSHTPIQYPRVQRKLARQQKLREAYEAKAAREAKVREQLGEVHRQPSVVAAHSSTPSVRFSGFTPQPQTPRPTSASTVVPRKPTHAQSQSGHVTTNVTAPPSPAPVAGPQSNVAAKPTRTASREEIEYGQQFAAKLDLDYAVEAMRDMSIANAQRVWDFIREHRLPHSGFGVEIARHHLGI
jgi:hypothetical protein